MSSDLRPPRGAHPAGRRGRRRHPDGPEPGVEPGVETAPEPGVAPEEESGPETDVEPNPETTAEPGPDAGQQARPDAGQQAPPEAGPVAPGPAVAPTAPAGSDGEAPEDAGPELPAAWALSGAHPAGIRVRRSGQQRPRPARRAWWAVAGRPGTRRRHGWRRLRLPAVLSLVVALLAAAAWIVGWSPLLDARTVSVQGVTTLSPAQVLAAARVSTGIPLARVDTAAIEDRVAALAAVRSVSVTRRFPHTVVVRVTERTPTALIVGDTGAVRLVDSTGALYDPPGSPPGNLPVLVDSGIALDVRSIAAGVTVLDSLPGAIRDEVVAVAVGNDDTVVLDLHTGRSSRTVVRWGTAGDTALKARVLGVLLGVTHDPWLDVSAPQDPVSRATVPAHALPVIPAVGRAAR